MRVTLLPLLVAFTALATASPALAQQMQPGLWETKAEMTLDGIALPTMDDTDCVAEKSAKDARRYVTRYLEANDCQVTSWTYNVPALTVGVRCNHRFGKGAGVLKGTLTLAQFKVKGVVKTSTDLAEMEFSVDFSGHYAHPCKKQN